MLDLTFTVLLITGFVLTTRAKCVDFEQKQFLDFFIKVNASWWTRVVAEEGSTLATILLVVHRDGQYYG